MTYSQKFFNSANESNPEGELAVNILVGNIIEIATAHANMLGSCRNDNSSRFTKFLSNSSRE